MRLSLLLCSFCAIILFDACKHKTAGTLDYHSLAYDSSKVSIFTWDTTKREFPKNSDPLPLLQSDLLVIDSLFQRAVDSFNQNVSPGFYESFDKQFPLDSFIIHQERYKRQYFPYKDVNGQRIVYIIAFDQMSDLWRTKPFYGRRHGGIHRLGIRVNLSEKTSSEISTGGYG